MIPSRLTEPGTYTIAAMYGQGDGNKWLLPPDYGFDAVRVTDIVEGSVEEAMADPQNKWAEVDDKVQHYKSRGIGWTLDLSYYRNAVLKSNSDPYATSARSGWESVFQTTAEHIPSDYPPVFVTVAGEVEWDVKDDVLIPFYTWAIGRLHDVVPGVPVCAGGFLHFKDRYQPRYNTLRRSILECGADLAAVHVYNDDDLAGLAEQSRLVHDTGAPFIVEECGVNEAEHPGRQRAWRFRTLFRAFQRARVDAVGLWGFCGGGDNDYTLDPSEAEDQEVFSMLRALQMGESIR